MIDIEDIIEAYKVARSNKKRSPDQVEFEMNWHMNCVRLYNDVVNHTLKPTAYTFVAKHPKPREVFAADMSIRVLHHYLDIRLRPLLEKRMTRHSFNNRVGMGQAACQNAVIADVYEMSKGYTEDCYVMKLDLSGCFPNISQDIAYRQLLNVIVEDYNGKDKDELIYILSVCIFSYPTHHCYRKSPMSDWDMIAPEKSLFNKPDGIGSAIGHLPWQNAVNFYFLEIDIWLESIEGILFERYVDDFYIIFRDKAIIRYIVPEMRRRLALLGAKLNERKFYLQHYSKGFECLGAHIKIDRIYPNKRIVRRGADKARNFNKCVRESKINRLLSSLNSYMGICKNGNGYGQAWKMVNTLGKRWNKYVHFDTERVCFVANDGYRTNDLIIKKYNLKRKRHDRKRKTRGSERAQRKTA